MNEEHFDIIKGELLFRIRKLRIKWAISLVGSLILFSLALTFIFLTTDAKWWVGIPMYLAGGYFIVFWFVQDKGLKDLRKKAIL